MLNRVIYFLAVILILLPACKAQPFFGPFFGWYRIGEHGNLRHAEELLRQKKYDEACQAYLDHINQRLALTDRPEWENPYFYYLLIGDVRLRQENVTASLAAYDFAEKMKVEPQLTSDRYRYVASWHEKKGELKSAIAVLVKYRDRDPLLFDAMLDRLAKELTMKEDLDNKKH